MNTVFKALIFMLRHGIKNSILHLKNRRLFDVPVSHFQNIGQTSLTDSQSHSTYANFCELASKDEKTFNQFRRAKVIDAVYDHVTLDLGKKYFAELTTFGPLSKKYKSVVQQIDSLGNPRQYFFPFFGKVSPTSLRYLKVYFDLKRLFGSFKNYSISEIGIGFGGQASLISLLDQPSVYNCFDIPSVLDLTKQFTSKLKIEGNYEFFDGRNPPKINSDLIISNYAFSELTKATQETYLENVILRSTRGYITWNSLGFDLLSAYSLADLVRLIPSAQIVPEVPYSHTGNAIIVWGHDR